jgi:hypothetical protein
MPRIPVSAVPSGAESGFIAAAVTTELVELLVAKGLVTRGEVIFLLQSLKESVEKDNRALAKGAAGILNNWVYIQEQGV